jgi:hypothetical protein
LYDQCCEVEILKISELYEGCGKVEVCEKLKISAVTSIVSDGPRRLTSVEKPLYNANSRKGGPVNKQRRQEKVHTVMGEFKRGTLHSGSKRGPKVTDRKQAIAVALNQARKE